MLTEDRTTYRAGLFILAAVALFVWVVFALGSQQGLWGAQYRLRASFPNVQGLVVGAPVRLAGLEVGMVEAIAFPAALEDRVDVALRLDHEESVRRRIRKDSIASIRALGPLGEKYVEVTMGSAGQPELGDGEELKAQEPIDFYSVMDAAQVEFDKLTRISEAFEAVIRDFRDSNVLDSLAGTARSMRASVEQVEKGDSLLHALIYDPKSKRIVESLAKASDSFGRITQEIAEGDGSLHALIYGKDVEQTVARLKALTADLEGLVKKMKDRQVVESLADASKNLKDITDKIAAGEGTAGAMVTDPSLYEKTEELLGGAQRSWMLRQVIKKSMKDGKKAKKDEKK